MIGATVACCRGRSGEARSVRGTEGSTLQTDLGAIDLFAKITGGGNNHDLPAIDLVLNAFGRTSDA
jgi:hypothetical protein